MTRDGDEVSGFSIGFDGHELRVRAWGFWSVELAASFLRALESETLTVIKVDAVRLDVSELKPMRDEGQLAWTRGLTFLMLRGIRAVQMSAPSPLTKLQFLRLCRNVGIVIQFE